jgi:hypothetical protein
VELVAYHAAEFAGGNFDTFADHHPALLDKRLLTRFYRSSTLADARARLVGSSPTWPRSPGRRPCEISRLPHPVVRERPDGFTAL